MDDISITQEEQKIICQSKSLKDIVFCYHKYYSNDKEFLNLIPDWNAFKKEMKKEYPTEDLPNCEDRIEKRYQTIQERFADIRKAFAIKPTIDFQKNQEALFWYTLLIRTEQKLNSWNVIRSLRNAQSVEFVHTYQRMPSLEEKQNFVNEIEFFIKKYSDIIVSKDITKEQKQQYLRNRTNFEILEILLYFDKNEIKDSLKELHLLDVGKLTIDWTSLDIAKIYHNYIESIKEKIYVAIKKTNREFALPSSFFPKIYDPDEIRADIHPSNTYTNISQHSFDLAIADAKREINTNVLYSAIHDQEVDDLESILPDIWQDRELEMDLHINNVILKYLISGFKKLDPEFYISLNAGNIQLFMKKLPIESKTKVRFDFARLISSYTNLASYLIVRPYLMREWGLGYL